MRNTLLPELSAEWPEGDARQVLDEWRQSGQTIAAHRLLVSAWHFQHRLTRYCRDLASRRAPPVPSADDALF